MNQVDGLNVWGCELAREHLSSEEVEYLSRVPSEVPPVEWVEGELDRVWRSFGLRNRRRLDPETLGSYYSHPVWLMNGIFTTVDPESVVHREAIARHVVAERPERVADFGGGFGELARLISELLPATRVSIVEPFSHPAEVHRLSTVPGVSYEFGLSGPYDVIIAQDVLEHVANPIGLAIDLASAARPGGTVVFANNFYPVIECHLPRTFYLRLTFPLVMRALGLTYRGPVIGCDYAQVFEVHARLWPRVARFAAFGARVLSPLLNLVVWATPTGLKRALSKALRH